MKHLAAGYVKDTEHRNPMRPEKFPDFKNGDQIARNQSSLLVRRQQRGSALTAECKGSAEEIYKLKLKFRNVPSGIDVLVERRCTCDRLLKPPCNGDINDRSTPVICKHLVALALTWVRDRGSFENAS